MRFIYKQIEKPNQVELRGVLNTPDNFDENKKYPTVIYFHGFADDRNGIQFMNIQNSKYLTANGYIVYRFDFSGCGESDGSFFDINLTRQVQEASMIHDFVENEPYVLTNNIFWKAHSLGGAVVTALAYQKNPKAISLFSPAVDFSLEENPLMRSMSEAFKTNAREKDGNDVGGLKISNAFMKDIYSYDLYKDASKYNGPVQILRGDKDKLVSAKVDMKLKDAFPNASYTEIKGTDHTYSNFDQRLECFELMKDFYDSHRD